MTGEFVIQNATSLFLGGLLLASSIGILEGFMHGKDDNGSFVFSKVLFSVSSPIVLYLVIGGAALYLATT
jgi:hypothetical protein